MSAGSGAEPYTYQVRHAVGAMFGALFKWEIAIHTHPLNPKRPILAAARAQLPLGGSLP